MLSLLVACSFAVIKSWVFFRCWLLGWGPYAYFRVLETLANPPPPSNAIIVVQNEQDVERQAENGADDQSNDRFLGLSIDSNSRSTMQETETERK